MKRLIVLLFLITSINVFSQKEYSVGLEINKFGASYRFFKCYEGELGANLYGDYKLNKDYLLRTEYNFGNGYYSTYKFNMQNLVIGIEAAMIKKHKIGLGYFIGSGIEYINLRSKEDNYNVDLFGWSIVSSLELKYRINEQISIYYYNKMLYAYMQKEINFSALNYYRHNKFWNTGVGLHYTFGKSTKEESTKIGE